MVKAAIYVRNATGNPIAIEAQIKLCKSYVEKCSYELAETYVDKNSSGLSNNRKMIDKAKRDIDKWDVLIVPAISHIGRDFQIVIDFVNKLQFHNKQIIFIREGLNLR
ncbi:MAG: recombinase family protein [Christensenellales bacterium]